jgi:hypothetical protein
VSGQTKDFLHRDKSPKVRQITNSNARSTPTRKSSKRTLLIFRLLKTSRVNSFSCSSSGISPSSQVISPFCFHFNTIRCRAFAGPSNRDNWRESYSLSHTIRYKLIARRLDLVFRTRSPLDVVLSYSSQVCATVCFDIDKISLFYRKSCTVLCQQIRPPWVSLN